MTDEGDILERLPSLLAELTKLPVKSVKPGAADDLLARLGPYLIAVEAKSNSRAAAVAQAAQSARAAAKRAGRQVIPLVAVPFMGDVGAKVCAEQQVGFVDLSGNADINAPGLRVRVSGKPNLFVQRGRPSSVFAPKSSRLARVMLQDPKRSWRQAELAAESQLGPGYVSRICKRLEEDRLIERTPEGGVRPRDPNLILEAWQSQYDFRRHDIRQGHVPSHSGEELARKLVEACGALSIPYALTGLAAAWLLAPFAGYRLVTVYLRKPTGDKLLQRLGWHEEKRGANLWLIRPNDEGVFHGAQAVAGVECVSPVQAYLDLHGLPERAEEAAEHLRKERLQWR
jgi:hypothetical protein